MNLQNGLYIVLAMMLVSLDGTYNITHKLFGNILGQPDQINYGVGMKCTNRGFLLHMLVFAALISLVK